MYYKVITRCVLPAFVAVEKQKVLHNLRVLVILVIQHAIVISGSTIFFPHYLISVNIFVKNLLNTKCVFLFFLQLLFEMFLILRRNERDMIENVYWSSCKVTLILSDFNKILTFFIYFRKTLTHKIY